MPVSGKISGIGLIIVFSINNFGSPGAWERKPGVAGAPARYLSPKREYKAEIR